ncbi:MAG: DUF4013 domain-containing protein [Myxococcota bacterium]
MQHMESISSYFRHPKWGMQLLLGSVCMLIPLVGMIAMLGYTIEVFVAQHRGAGDHYAEFDFNRFGPYLGLGIWPILAGLIVMLCALPLGALVFAPLAAIPVMELENELIAIPIAATGVLYIGVVFLVTFISLPINIRGALTQHVGTAFSRTWIVDFIKRVWGPMIVMHLFLFAISIPMMMVGYLTCGFGFYPVTVVLLYSTWHLYRQLYEIYLERGGTPIEIDAKLLPKEAPALDAPQTP